MAQHKVVTVEARTQFEVLQEQEDEIRFGYKSGGFHYMLSSPCIKTDNGWKINLYFVRYGKYE